MHEQDHDEAARVAAYLKAFALDFNTGEMGQMQDHYVDTFTAIVDGVFIDREAYLRSTAALHGAGYEAIQFDLNKAVALCERFVLADGTTTITSPEGQALSSRFSILCERGAGRLRFAYAHSSTQKAHATFADFQGGDHDASAAQG